MENITPLLAGEKLLDALRVKPLYDESIRAATSEERLLALNDLYDVFHPTLMTCEIYTKLYLAYIRAMKKKRSKEATQQGYLNHSKARCDGIIGGGDSFTIIGASGVGKSSSISRAISVITNGVQNICVIPFLVVQTPCDASLKGLLLEVLRLVDDALETRYYRDATRAGATTDLLIGLVSQVCLNHIGVLVVDEAQNLLAKNGKNLVSGLVQLINNSGISLVFVGTLESKKFFESAFHLARRSVGLECSKMGFDDNFISLCEELFRYQYTRHRTALTHHLVEWLYLHSKGIVAIVVGLLHAAQEIAILSDLERVDVTTLEMAYKQRFQMLHNYLYNDNRQVLTPKKTTHMKEFTSTKSDDEFCSFATFAMGAKASKNPIEYLKQQNIVEVIALC